MSYAARCASTFAGGFSLCFAWLYSLLCGGFSFAPGALHAFALHYAVQITTSSDTKQIAMSVFCGILIKLFDIPVNNALYNIQRINGKWQSFHD